MKKNDAVRFVLFAGLLIGTAIPVGAQTTFSAHVEGGFGASVVRPLVSEGALSAMGSAGASARIDRRLRVGLEVTAMAGGPTGMRIPEAATPGDRSLTTFLIGLESTSRDRSRGAFGFIGAGAGHMSLSDATGVFEPPFDRWLVPPRSLTAFAIGAAAGCRFAGGPGPLGFSTGFQDTIPRPWRANPRLGLRAHLRLGVLRPGGPGFSAHQELALLVASH